MDDIERQTEDGTFYKQVSPGKWQMVTRETTDGIIYKKVGEKKWSPVETTKQPDSGWGEAFRAKVASAATLGYAPELYAGGKQLIENMQSVLPGGHEADKGVYDRELANYRNYTRNLEIQHPVASLMGTLAGYVAPGSAIAKGVRSVKPLIGMAPEAATLLGKSATLGAEGAIFGAAHRPSTDQDAVNIPERLETAATNAAFGMALPVAGEAIKSGYSAIKTVPKKLLSVFGGVDEGMIDTFLKNPDEYLSARPREEVIQTVTDLVNNVNNKVAEGKSSVKDAKESLRWAGQQIRESASENHAIAREQLRQAETNLADKFKETVQDIKSKPAPTYLQGQIDDTLRSMKKQNIDASKESFDILQGEVGARQKIIDEARKASGKVNVKDLPPELQVRIDQLKDVHDRDKLISKAIDEAQNANKGPYVSDERIKRIGWAPNYAAEPTGIIGERGINVPFPTAQGKNPDPFLWADDKYKATRQLVKKHIDQGIPIEINTSSDLIGKSDWLEALPKDTKVNMYLLTKDPDLNRILFPSNPSRLRQESAIKQLKDAGISVNSIEPTAESILDALGEKELRSRIWKHQLGQSGEPILKNTTLDKIMGMLQSNIDDAERKSIRLVKPIESPTIESPTEVLSSISPLEEKPPKTTINVKSIYSDMKKRVVDLSSRNSSDAKAAAKRLSEYMQDLKEKTMDPDGNTTWWMDASEAKRIIQDLDSDVQTWDSSKIAGAFDDKFNQNLKIMRNSIDTKLKKEFPSYKAKMKEISERAKILDEGSKRFGNPQLAYSRLSNIGSDKAKFDRELLRKLGNQSGQDFDTPIAEYVANQKLLKDPRALAKIRRELPEFDQLTEAQRLEKLAQIDKGPRAFREKLKKSPSFKDLKMAEKDFDSALVDRDKIKGWTEATVDSKIKSVMRGREYITKQLEALGKMSDQDLVRMVNQLRVNDAFEREFRIGSRNVNLWTAMGVGTVGGGPIGLITGAVIGGFIDRYGPSITKQILIGVSKIRGNPTVSKLMAVNIPRPIAKNLADSFYGSVLGLSTMESKKSIVNRARGQAKWANDGYEKVKVYAQDKEDLDLLSELDKLNQANPAVRDTLIQLSDFRPGSVGFEKALKKLRTLNQSGE
jgi:hypothetical protein